VGPVEAEPDESDVAFVYEGSLPTPPCSERVLWLVFKEPMPLAPKQLEQQQSLSPVDNDRGAQPRNGRVADRAESARDMTMETDGSSIPS